MTAGRGRRPLGDALAEYQACPTSAPRQCTDVTCGLATWNRHAAHAEDFCGVARQSGVTSEFYSAITGSRPLPEFMNPENLDRIMRVPDFENEGLRE